MFPVIRRPRNAVVLAICLFSAFGSAHVYAHGGGGGGGHGGGGHGGGYAGSTSGYHGGGGGSGSRSSAGYGNPAGSAWPGFPEDLPIPRLLRFLDRHLPHLHPGEHGTR
jgi:hypothetical protein